MRTTKSFATSSIAFATFGNSVYYGSKKTTFLSLKMVKRLLRLMGYDKNRRNF